MIRFPELHILPNDSLTLVKENIKEHESESEENEEVDQPNGLCYRYYTCACCNCSCLTTCCCSNILTRYWTTFYNSSFLTQVLTLTRRFFLADIRDRQYIMTWVLGIVMMLFLGILYLNVSTPLFSITELPSINNNMVEWGACSQNFTTIGMILNTSFDNANNTVWSCGTDINNAYLLGLARESFIYQILVSMFFSEFPQVAFMYNSRLLFQKEHSARAYSSSAWVFAWIAKISFCGFLKGLVYPPFVYFLGKLPIERAPYFLFSIYIGLMAVVGGSAALFVVVLFESFEAASVAFIFIKTISQALSGYYITKAYIPWWFRWIFYSNFFRYTFEGATLAQTLTKANQNLLASKGQSQVFYNAQARAWFFALITIVICIFFQVASILLVVWLPQLSKKIFTCSINIRPSFIGARSIIGN